MCTVNLFKSIFSVFLPMMWHFFLENLVEIITVNITVFSQLGMLA